MATGIGNFFRKVLPAKKARPATPAVPATGRTKWYAHKSVPAIGAVLFLLLFVGPCLVDELVVVNTLTNPLADGRLNAVPAGYEEVKGTTYVSTLINLIDTEMDRPLGGFRPDNAFWFAWPFDDVRNFQLGVMENVERQSLWLKERASRSGGGSDQFDAHLKEAASDLQYKKTSWLFTAGRIRNGRTGLMEYREALKNEQAVFLTRQDALYELLRAQTEMLGDTHDKLSRWIEKDGEAVSGFTDDNYYFQGLGTAYVTLAIVRAVKVDFADVIRDRAVTTYFDEMEAYLKHATLEDNPPWFILDGSPSAQFWPNHRSNLETNITSARLIMGSIMGAIAPR